MLPKKKARSASSSTTASPPSRPPYEDGEDEEEEDAAAASQDDAEENDTEVQEEEAEGDAAADDDDDDTKQPARKKAKKKVKESVIDHTYRDYSQVEAPLDEDDDDETGGGTTTKGKSELSSRGFQSFPSKLHAILSNPNYQHIIRWMVSERGYHHFGYCCVVPVLLLLAYLTPANINIVLFSLLLL